MVVKSDYSDQTSLVNNHYPSIKEDGNKRDQDAKKNWKNRLLARLRSWLDESSSQQQQHSNWKNSSAVGTGAAATLLVLSSLALYKYRRRLLNSQKYKNYIWPLVLAMVQRPEYKSAAVDVSLSFLQSLAKSGGIGRALVGPSEIFFQDSKGSWKRSMLPKNNPALQSELMDMLCNGGCADVSALPDSLWARIGPAILTALPFVYLALMYKILKSTNGNDMSSKLLDGNQQSTRFGDVAGLDPIMEDVKEIVSFLKDPSVYNSLGAKPPRGVLFHGPPGSGKTLLAQAIAGEADCDAFIACCGSDFCEMYVGRGASRVRSVFAEARSTAKRRHSTSSWLPWKATVSKRPATAIIFIDELDALAKSRSYDTMTNNDERDQTLNQLLTEMDGFPSQEQDVITIIIAATNRVDVLDPAIIRRFDRRIHITYPDVVGRQEIMKIHARKTACCLENIDWEYLASEEMTGAFSGSDLRGVVNDAALMAVRDSSSTITQSHYNHAIRRVRAMKATSSSPLHSNRSAHWFPVPSV